MKRLILYLACDTTLPSSPRRRVDAHEHDLEFAALERGLTARGFTLKAVDWEDPHIARHGAAVALVRTTWNYQDVPERFLKTLQTLEAQGTPVLNPPHVIGWNLRKTYLREMARDGASTLKTVWLDTPTTAQLEAARIELGNDDIVVKRQVGAGAFGQKRFKPGEPITWVQSEPVLVQAFEPAIVREGELSFIFVGDLFSHALIKRAAPNDYRIQSLYGGIEEPIQPTPSDLHAARCALSFAPEGTFYARVDMVRGPDGVLRLMELELIEPYLYPIEGPRLGDVFAQALEQRLAG